jgi:pimeloyl-ACP methyl ester carboxylesterase
MSDAQPGLTEEFLFANGLRFHVATQGSGPVALLLHGFPENWRSWRHQLPALAAAGFRAAAPDLRGYNLTDRPARVVDYRMHRLAGDVQGLIAALGGGPVHLIAHDWGGAIAWFYAARRPQDLLSLTILNAPHPKIFRRHLFGNLRQLRRSWYMFYFQLPWLPERHILRDAKNQFDRMFRGWAFRKEMFSDDVIAGFREPMLAPGALTAAINYYRASLRRLATSNEAAGFPKIKVPTQVIWAEKDRALGPELCDGLEQEIDAPFELRRIADCSHWVQQEQPEQVNEYMLEFLRKHPAH